MNYCLGVGEERVADVRHVAESFMAIPLSVLIVEDSANDAELVVHELHCYGFDPRFERVESFAAMKAALEKGNWDLIISDYSIRDFNGMEALALFKKHGVDIPFICVSGTMGEELAVTVMRSGAHDYILKDKLARLGPAIKRELRAAEERRKSKKVESMAAHLAAIVESSDDAIISKTLDGTVLSWNRAAERTYGYSAKEMIGHSIKTIIPPDHHQELPEIFRRLHQGLRVDRYETVRQCKDGRLVDISLTVSPIKDGNGKIVAASGIGRDISERKRQEQERSKLIGELKEALAQVSTLSGLLPICAWCKKIRDDGGYWQQVETYFKLHSRAEFTHSICPECMEKVKPEGILRD